MSVPLASVGARRAASDVALQLLSRTINLGLGIAVTIVLVRSLGDRDFGRWSTVLATVQIAGYLADLRLDQVAVQRAAAEPQRETGWLSALLSLRLLIAVPAAVVAASACLLLANGSSMATAGIVISATLLVNAAATAGAIFQLRVRNAVNAALEMSNGLLWGVAVFLVAALGGGLVGFALAFLAALAATTAAQVWMALRTLPLRLRGSSALWGELGRVGVVAGFSGLLILAYGRIDQVLVYGLSGTHDAGLYAAVYRIFDRVQMVPGTVLLTIFPILAAAHGAQDVARTRRVFQTALEYLMMVSLPTLAFAIVAARPSVQALFGSSFAAAAPALPILMGAFIVVSCGYLIGYMVLVLSLQRRFLLYAVLALVFNVALNVALIPVYGFIAAAWVTLATELLVMSLTARNVLRAMEMRPKLGRIMQIALCSAVMAGALALARSAGAPFGLLAGLALLSYVTLLLASGVLRPAQLRALRRGEL